MKFINFMKKKYVFLVFFAVVFFVSCTPKIAITVDNQNQIVAELNIKPSLATKKLIKSLSGFAEGSSFDSEETEIQNEKTEDGMEIIRFKKTSSLELDALLKFPSSYDLGTGIFELNVAEKKLICSLDRKKLKAFFENISPQDKEYLELLMAPSLQDDEMSEDEYIALIASAYGGTVAGELKTSVLSLSFQLPKQIKSISITPKYEYKLEGNTAYILIPLQSILVLASPINIVLQY